MLIALCSNCCWRLLIWFCRLEVREDIESLLEMEEEVSDGGFILLSELVVVRKSEVV